ncbi:hypothetical protein FGO68_gene9430 [Halteria grandinella]|uniref:Uncharacterized protein n=1 Tax=Halteria grandinella TaxID=5974 RepID=A0A8J8P3E8_HALGN|nr:hypothetical protein FGO68_gene9430 [Halteria grandinella]
MTECNMLEAFMRLAQYWINYLFSLRITLDCDSQVIVSQLVAIVAPRVVYNQPVICLRILHECLYIASLFPVSTQCHATEIQVILNGSHGFLSARALKVYLQILADAQIEGVTEFAAGELQVRIALCQGLQVVEVQIGFKVAIVEYLGL